MPTPPPPPPQKKKKGPFFWGGMFFWDKFVNFCPFRIKKFWKDLGTKPTSRLHIGQLPADSGRKSKFKISKIWDFCYFWAKFGLFFFKCPNVEQNSLKRKIILFFSFRTSQRWNLVLVNIFWLFGAFLFFNFFEVKYASWEQCVLGCIQKVLKLYKTRF